MLTSIPDLPANVVGFTASGKVTADDYQSILVPALEQKLGKLDRVRLLYVLGKGIEGISGADACEGGAVGEFRISVVPMKNLSANTASSAFALAGVDLPNREIEISIVIPAHNEEHNVHTAAQYFYGLLARLAMRPVDYYGLPVGRTLEVGGPEPLG